MFALVLADLEARFRSGHCTDGNPQDCRLPSHRTLPRVKGHQGSHLVQVTHSDPYPPGSLRFLGGWGACMLPQSHYPAHRGWGVSRRRISDSGSRCARHEALQSTSGTQLLLW